MNNQSIFNQTASSFPNFSLGCSCSDIKAKFCGAIVQNTDIALALIGISLAVMMLKGRLHRFMMEKYRIDYFGTMLLPELMILISFIFMVFVRLS